MKFFIVTSIQERETIVHQILNQSKIAVFSSMPITGYKIADHPNLLEEWFAAGDEQCDSIMVFSFTNDDRASEALQKIVEYNNENPDDFPIRAFIVPVEKASF